MDGCRKRNLIYLITAFLLLFFLLLPLELNINLDKNLRLFEGQQQSFNLKFPLDLYIKADKDGIININGNPISCKEYSRLAFHNNMLLQGLNTGSVNLELSLFKGLIPIRQLTVNVLPEMKLVPGGHSIGIKLYDEGVIVVGYYYIEKDNDVFSPAENSGVLIGDVIVAVNGHRVKDIDMAAEIIKAEAEKGSLHFTIIRGREEILKEVTPHLCPNSNEKRIGLYIRDTAAGVGYLTFYDRERDCYGTRSYHYRY